MQLFTTRKHLFGVRLSINPEFVFVKTPKILIVITLLLFLVVLLLSFSTQKTASQRVKDNYLENLIAIQKKLNTLQKGLKDQKPVKELRQLFLQSRLSYKKIAWLIDFFNPYEARLLNGPALRRTEEDNPQTIIDPEGFQVLEELLFDSRTARNSKLAMSQVNKILNTITRLQQEPDLQYKFQDGVLFNALQAALIRLSSMGISGFDSPIAAYSLLEAPATLDGVIFCIQQYKPLIEKNNKTLYPKFSKLALAAKKELATKSFQQFDRISFLKKNILPLYSIIHEIRTVSEIEIPAGLMPVNQQVKSFVDADFFNIDFFSPNSDFRVTPERAELGRKLFFDPILSGTKNRSCGTCHKPELAFTDGLATALDIDGKSSLSRNTPTLWNSVFQTRQFFDSRTATLENQLSDVVHNTKEMRGSLQANIPQLKQDEFYYSSFAKAYPNEKDPVTQYNIANAIASYIRSLVALNSRFDQYMRGNETKITAAEKNGFNLFMGKAKCGTCHYFPLFNGLVPPDFNETESEVLGVPATKSKTNAILDADLGKYNFTNSIIHKHAFKTPTVRNIELTAPYMHNGVFNTLEEVMDFYNEGGGAGLKIAPENQTLPKEKLNLSKKEIADIISFLRALTDPAIKDYRQNQ